MLTLVNLQDSIKQAVALMKANGGWSIKQFKPLRRTISKLRGEVFILVFIS